MIRHILLIKFKQDAPESELLRLKALFEAMPNLIDGVVSVEWGENDSPEG